jgi:Spermine/spermidine synthase domain
LRARLDIFLASLLILFLELACIRWFPAHVLFLTFFTNTVLLACFLGMSVGCLAARHPRNYLIWTPGLLALALAAAHLVDYERRRSGSIVNVGDQASAQHVFFGAEYQIGHVSGFVIPIEAVCGFFFLLIALALVGPGQQLGRALDRLRNRIEAYTLNILGSIVGIALFALCAWYELSPIWWFVIVLAGLTYFLMPDAPARGMALGLGPALVLFLAASGSAPWAPTGPVSVQQFWSPYYRIDYDSYPKVITVNLIGHQQMVSRRAAFPAYALPYLLNRDAGQPQFGQVLIIGAGSGNDVSRALDWGAARVDAVEIDPVIYRLGKQHHPDRPYDDPRVVVHLDDGRNFLRSTRKKYDLIVYALVDSLVLHSGYSNIRLESYLFTTQAFQDVRARLNPGGVFVMYNYFRQGWMVARLRQALEQTFGSGNSLVLNLPARAEVTPDQVLYGEFTVLFAGATDPLRKAFERAEQYWLQTRVAPGPHTPNGFDVPTAAERSAWRAPQAELRAAGGWMRFYPTRVHTPQGGLRVATDDWPFLYLRGPMIPSLSLRGMGIMGLLAVMLIAPFVFRRGGLVEPVPGTARGPGFTAQMFFLGAGFMLIETKAVVHMALLFGSTWAVNSVVFVAVLLMILLANLFVLAVRIQRVAWFYAALLVSLAANSLVPMDYFLGMDRTPQIVGSCVLAFAPVLFAGVVFAVSFGRAADPDRAFGTNIAGAMFGGLAEYSSMLVGFQYLLFVAAAFYALSAVGRWWSATRLEMEERLVVVATQSK